MRAKANDENRAENPHAVKLQLGTHICSAMFGASG